MNTQTEKEMHSFQPLDLQEDAVFGQINDLVQLKKYKEACDIVNMNFIANSHRPEFLMLASQVYKEMEQSEQECKVLEKLINIQRKPRYLTLYSEALTRIDDFPKALKVLHEVLDESDGKDPILFEVYKNMGNIYLKCGDIDAAEEKYNLANAINSEDENLIINYGVLAIQKGEYESAKERFTQVIGLNTCSDLAWVGMGLVHRAYGDHDLSRACLLRGLDENPYNKLAITNYYQWCSQDGIDATEEIVTAFMDKFPNDIEMSQLSNGLNQ